jgi:hypothetical protein
MKSLTDALKKPAIVLSVEPRDVMAQRIAHESAMRELMQ